LGLSRWGLCRYQHLLRLQLLLERMLLQLCHLQAGAQGWWRFAPERQRWARWHPRPLWEQVMERLLLLLRYQHECRPQGYLLVLGTVLLLVLVRLLLLGQG
jgi:hypothetical protein